MALNAQNILDHNLGKFGIVTVIDAEMYALADRVVNGVTVVKAGEPILALDTLKIANISSESSMKEVRGGQSATQLIIYDFARTINLEVQDALASMASLQYLLGSELTESGVQKHFRTTVTAGVSGAIALPNVTLVAGTKLTLVEKNALTGAPIASETITVDLTPTTGNATTTGGSSTIVVANLDDLEPAEGDVYEIFGLAAAATGATELTLRADSFSENVKLVGKTFLVDQASGQRRAAELVIHNFHLSPTFTLAFDSEGDAGVFDFSGMALEDTSGQMFTIKYLNEAPGA
jgi:hypothetical protein